MSVYGYTYQNPVNYIDPNGKQNHWATKFMNEKEKQEFEQHWPMVKERGGNIWLMRRANNYRAISGRYVTRGASLESESSVLQKNGPLATDPDRGSDVGAARHTLWSAILASKEGREKAQIIADAHEELYASEIDFNNVQVANIESIVVADMLVDELNNRVERNFGMENKGKSYKYLAFGILKLFREKGLFVLEQGKDGGYNIIRRNITEKQYNDLKNRFEELNNDGKDKRDIK